MCKVDWLEVKKNFPELLMYKVDWLEVEKNFPKVLVYKCPRCFLMRWVPWSPLKLEWLGLSELLLPNGNFPQRDG